MFIEFDYREGLFNVKMPNFPKNIFGGQVPAHSGSNILGPATKFKIPLPRLFSPGPNVIKLFLSVISAFS
jgi:hypothetical protein